MQPFAQRLRSGPVLVGDGATGTMLFHRALAPGQAPEYATLVHPEVVAEIAGLYLEAGAEIIETNTFGASPMKLDLAGLGHEVVRVNREGVRIAREVARRIQGNAERIAPGASCGGESGAPRAYVAASCGPCGRLLEPYGDVTRDAVYDGFSRQMEVLLAAGVDTVFVETMTDLEEAKLAVRAVRDISPRVPVAAMMTFESTPRGFYTIMGISVADAARGLLEEGADAVGANCGTGIDEMTEIAREFRRHTEAPLVIQPNAGVPRTHGNRTIYDQSPSYMAVRARGLVEAGVAVIGGCCGTTPQHIRAIRDMVESLGA